MSRDHQFSIDGNRLILRTLFFVPERGSVPHSGILNRELASVLSASAISGVFFILLPLIIRHKILLYTILLFIFAVIFRFFRAVIFNQPFLETIFDKSPGLDSVVLKRPLKTVHRPYPITAKAVSLSHWEFEPPNPDGIEVVEKVALQHGTVIPGFGETKDFYNVELAVKDKGEQKRINIFTTDEKEKAEAVMSEIIDFLGGNNGNHL
ncbi:MAG: hypothetical protein ACUVS3_11680 [Thermodesulfobacteriota bacterium]